MEVKEYLIKKHHAVEPSNEGFTIDLEKIVDYCIYVYTPQSEDVVQLHHKKEAALIDLGITKKKDRELLLENKSHIVSNIITDLLHVVANREYELYISALEAATILLEVVRRPVDDKLSDEKWANALKAKKQGFMDARDLIASANEIAEKITGAKETDLEEHVEEVTFKEGLSEVLAKMANKKK
jgi:hypothetical protein